MKQNWTRNQNEIDANNKIFVQRLNYFKKFGVDRVLLRDEVISKIDFDPDNLIEIGTGKGNLTVGLAEKFGKIVTIDNDKDSLYQAYLNACYENVENKIEFIFSSAEKIEYEDVSFDVSVSAFSFHHFGKPFTVFDEMIRVTKRLLVISDFNQAGFAILDKIHESEGRYHEMKPNDFSILGVYLQQKGFIVQKYNGKWQEIYIAKRQVKK